MTELDARDLMIQHRESGRFGKTNTESLAHGEFDAITSEVDVGAKLNCFWYLGLVLVRLCVLDKKPHVPWLWGRRPWIQRLQPILQL